MSECPVCLNVSQDDVNFCPVCNWDLSIYLLSPDGLKQEQESRLNWAIEVWQEFKTLREERELIFSEYALKEQWIDTLFKVFRDLEVGLEDENQSLKHENKRLNHEVKELKTKLKSAEDKEIRESQISAQCKRITDKVFEREWSEGKLVSVALPESVKDAIKKRTRERSRGEDGLAHWLRVTITYGAIKERWL
ncbi:hypothetical protein NDI44_25035 [Trichocoleus sp. DQ-A3]|uniref:hypothetical protein n=1 Tax=Cyanophyceae TaxID=3028117 RepID=UPI0016872CE9|nr:hypothetical protein [Coleofasciculus sp. FACHB-125]MBD1901896.1 hypothetical protein [Coleofasciculus sp. FACHB-125]